MVTDMINFFNKNVLFYIKTLAIYAFLAALLYCPTMHYDEKYDESTVGSVTEASGISVADEFEVAGIGTGKISYPYARIMSLIEQCLNLESLFRSIVARLAPHRDVLHNQVNIDDVKNLLKMATKLHTRLCEEVAQFSDYVAAVRSKQRDAKKVDYSCSSGKCRYKIKDRSALFDRKAALSRDNRSKKVMLYTRRVLARNGARVSFIVNAIQEYLDRVEREEKAAKARSLSEAKSYAIRSE